ncbi:MBL fold metallo-hydrolase [Umezawaea sp. Da 62-37]|uniref:MBL fold metallo-hydrolase n=1 Tax=Umezawaea sp. Da 62-37 TaxID=3075927 RepID=UPI0028F7402E|nr:MBL fold metallo-hydrolase [Umezawaea sp. Da 62-37]WNV84668.1 MBL fold metallo-hydrolase [Umezawaea sp. Da 62-37]
MPFFRKKTPDAEPLPDPEAPQPRRIRRRTVIAGAVGLVGVGAATAGYFTYLAPSGDVSRYAAHLVDDDRDLRAGEVRVTFLGTTTLLVDDGVTQLLFDAFLTDVPLTTALFGDLKTDEGKVDRTLAAVGADRVKAVFVSHSHYDHSLDAAYLTRKTGAVLHGSESTLNVGRGGGVPEERLAPYETGKPLRIGDFTVTVLASKHSPGTVGGDGTPITGPLAQPAKAGDYLEGGSFDFLVEHGGHSLLVKASAGFLPGGLDGVRADALFCGTAGSFGKDAAFREEFHREVVSTVDPKLFVPLHWNDFFTPVTGDLTANMKAVDDVAAAWDYLIARLEERRARFAVLQGYRAVILFGSPDRAA